MDFVNQWSEKTVIGTGCFFGLLKVSRSTFYEWRGRRGKVNDHNGWRSDMYVEHYNAARLLVFLVRNNRVLQEAEYPDVKANL